MTNRDIDETGLYRLFFKGGGGSVRAAVGMLNNGDCWYAPSNWSAQTPAGIACGACGAWDKIERAEKIEVGIQ